MSFPFRAGLRPSTFNRLVELFRCSVERVPDQRTGANVVYSLADAALGAFSVFFTQSPSFSDFQRTLELTKGWSNAQSLFGMTRTPSDNPIRNWLDPVPPSTLFPVFSHAVKALHELGHLKPYRSLNGDLLVALDGTQYFSSSTLHCDHHPRRTHHQNGTVTSSHRAVTPVIVAPGNPRVIPLEPEFITPQDGHEKPDCENAAAKRGLSAYGARYRALGVTILGDDLYCKQPLCEAFIREGLNFILVRKPSG